LVRKLNFTAILSCYTPGSKKIVPCNVMQIKLLCSLKQFWFVYHSLSPNRRRIPQILNNGTDSVESSVSKANLFVSHFSSCFTRPPPSVSHDPPSPPANEAGLSSVSCSPEDLHKLLSTLRIKTASGPDGLSSHMLCNTATAIASSLSNLFNLSFSSGVVPSEWKLSNVTPVYKGSGDQKCVTNYKPISLLSLVSNVLEHIVHNHLLNFLLSNNLLSLRQFGTAHLRKPCLLSSATGPVI